MDQNKGLAKKKTVTFAGEETKDQQDWDKVEGSQDLPQSSLGRGAPVAQANAGTDSINTGSSKPSQDQTSTSHMNLVITVQSLEALYQGDFMGLDTPDPGVRLQFKGTHSCECKTTLIKNQQNPVYQESFSFLLSPDEIQELQKASANKDPAGPSITFSVIEDELLTDDKILAEKELSLQDLFKKDKIFQNEGDNFDHKGSSILDLPSVEVKSVSKAKSGGKDQKKASVAGTIVARVQFGWELQALTTPAMVLSAEKTDEERVAFLKDKSRAWKLKKGVLMAHVQGAVGFQTDKNKDEYEVAVQLLLKKDLAQAASWHSNNLPERQKCILQCDQKTPVLQGGAKKLLMKAPDIFNQHLSLNIIKKSKIGKGTQIGSFSCPLTNCLDLIDGQRKTFMLDEFQPAGNYKSATAPKFIISLTYLCSIFTQKDGAGNLEFTIKSWTKGASESLETNTFATMQLQDENGKGAKLNIVDAGKDGNKVAAERFDCGARKTLTTNQLLQAVELQISQPNTGISKLFEKFMNVGNTKLFVAELFENEMIPAIVNRHLLSEPIPDAAHESLIKISYTSRFTPKDITDEERKLWDANKRRLESGEQSGPNRAQNLIQQKPDEKKVEEQKKVEQVQKRKKIKRDDNQANNLFSLSFNGQDQFLFAEKPRGVVLIQLHSINIKWKSSQSVSQSLKKIYMLVSTGRELIKTRSVLCDGSSNPDWGNDVLKISTYEAADQVFFKLYDEMNPGALLGEGKLNPQMLFVQTPAYQRTQATVVLKLQEHNWGVEIEKPVNKDNSFLIQLEMMYRCSEFTKNPRGKLDVVVEQGIDMKIIEGNAFKEYEPIMEFEISDQRIQFDQTPKKNTKAKSTAGDVKSWTENNLLFNTYNIGDVIRVRFYERRADGVLTLIGTDTRDLSSLLLVDSEFEAANNAKGSSDDDDAPQYFNYLNIDLSRINRSLKGEIRVRMNFLPRKTPSNQKTDLKQKLREADMVSFSKNNKSKADDKGGNKKDIAAFMLNPTSLDAMKSHVCYFKFEAIFLRNIDARACKRLRQIVVEISYGKNKKVTRCSLNLAQSKNIEYFNEFFRLALRDLTEKALNNKSFTAHDDHELVVRAFSINLNAPKAQDLNDDPTKIQIGESRISSALLRQIKYTDIKLNFCIEVPKYMIGDDNSFKQDLSADEDDNKEINDAEMDELDEFKRIEKQAAKLNEKMDEDIRKGEQQMTVKRNLDSASHQYLLVQLSVFSTQTKIINNPVGVLSMCNVNLFNLDSRLQGLNLDRSPQNTLKIRFEGNEIITETGNAKRAKMSEALYEKDQAGESLKKDQASDCYCLQTSDGQIVDSFLYDGKNFNLEDNFQEVGEMRLQGSQASRSSAGVYQWTAPAMFNMFCTSNLSNVSLALVLGTTDLNGKHRDLVIARASLTLADLALYFESSASKSINYAFELDFQPIPDQDLKIKALEVQKLSPTLGYGHEEQSSHASTGFRNLLSHFYDHKLILSMQINFNSEVFKEARQLKGLKCVQNRYVMPHVVSYQDYISSGYDDFIRKQKIAKQQQKIKKNQALTSAPALAAPPRSHVLVTLSMESIMSVLQPSKFAEVAHGFIACEPLYEVRNGFLSDYLDSAELLRTKGAPEDLAALFERRGYHLKKNLGDVLDESIALPQDVFTPDLQLTPVFALQNAQSDLLDLKLQSWLTSGVTKVVVSLISQTGPRTDMEKFREYLAKQPLMQSYNVLGAVRRAAENSKDGQVDGVEVGYDTSSAEKLSSLTVHQAVLDISGALNYEKKAPDGSVQRNQSSGQISQVVQLRTLSKASSQGEPTFCHNAGSLGNIKASVETSDFVDCPSGEVNVIVKKISTNNQTIHSDQNFVRVELVSPVPRDKIVIDVSSKKDVADSQPLSHYGNRPTPEDGFNNLMVNHVTNAMSRHFKDKIVISVLQKQGANSEEQLFADSNQEAKPLFKTTLELNKLSLKDKEVNSFTLIATGAQRVKTKSPIYYKIELDVIYRAKTIKSPAMGAFEQARENYKLMMGRDRLTPMEEEILEMLVERQKIAAKLTPSCLRWRRARFFMRRLRQVEYKTLDGKKKLRLLVSPLTFMFQVFSSGGLNVGYDHYRVMDLRQRVEKELSTCAAMDASMKEALEAGSKSSQLVTEGDFVNFKEGNLLQIQLPPGGLDLEEYNIKTPNKPLAIKKLVFMVQLCQVGKPAVTVFNQEYPALKLLSLQAVLQNHQISIANVGVGVEIRFAIMVVPENRGAPGKKEVLQLHGSGSLFLSEFAAQLKNNKPISAKLMLCKRTLDLQFKVIQNSLTRQPHRVISVSFHRLIKVKNEGDLIDANSGKSRDDAKEANKINLVLMENPCIEKMNEITRVEELMPMDDERGGEVGGDKSEQLVKGSINDTIKNNTKEEQISSRNLKYNLFIDFDTTEPYKGVHKAMKKVDINKFGKAVDRELNQFDINNTSASNKIRFKVFRDGTRQAERLRQFDIGLEALHQKDGAAQDKYEVGQIAEAEIDLAHLASVQINKPVGFVCPLRHSTDDADPKSLQYKIENVFALFTITITDKTFGELVMDLNQFRKLPECKEIREMQYRITVKPTEDAARSENLKNQALEDKISKNTKEAKKKQMAQSDLDKAGKARIEPVYQYLSERIPYDITNTAQLSINRELVIGLKMKDIFSNRRLFMSPGAADIYKDQDYRIFVDFFGIGPNAGSMKSTPKILIGQLEYGLIEMIQKYLKDEEDKVTEQRRQKAREEREEEEKQQAQDAPPEEEVSGKALALEQDMARRQAIAEEKKKVLYEHRQKLRKMRKAGASVDEIRKLDDAFEAQQQEERVEESKSEMASNKENRNSKNGNPSNKSRRSAPPTSQKSLGKASAQEEEAKSLPKGYAQHLVPNVDSTADADEATDYAVGQNRPAELISFSPGIKLFATLSWQFSFKKREEKTAAYYAHLADMQELERTRERKKIVNILRALHKLRGDKNLLARTMDMLSLVLASESCIGKGESVESLETHQVLTNVPELLKTFRSMFIEFKEVKLPIMATVSLMKCCLYMKIICKGAGPKHLQVFMENFQKAGIFSEILEVFQAFQKESKFLSCKILTFVTYMIYDISQLYFDNLSGVRLEPLLEYVNHSSESSKDSEIVACHGKFVNACCHCLFEYQPDPAAPDEDKDRIVRNDMKTLAVNICGSIDHLISGGMNTSYKQDFEQIAKQLCDSCIRFIHLSIQKYKMLKEEKSNTLSKIFEGVYQMIVDSIASGLSMDFIDGLKQQLNYEISLISQMDIKRELNLMFDNAVVMSRLQKLADIYWANLEYNAQVARGEVDYADDYRQDSEPYFDRTKLMLEFFADQDCMNSFGENNTKMIKKILSDPTVSNSSDFIIFLHNVVEADLAIESEVEGENAKQRHQRLMKEKYGNITNINKFSISHIEWLEDQMPELLL